MFGEMRLRRRKTTDATPWKWPGLLAPHRSSLSGGSRTDTAESVPALILAVVIVILAGPQQLSEPRLKRALTNIEFCVDVSGSMNARFGDGTRYDASMSAIDDFLDYRDGDAFGLTFFVDSLDGCQKAVAPAREGFDKPRIRSRIPQGVTKLAGGGVQAAVEIDVGVAGPEPVLQLLPSNNFPRLFDEGR